ncbi:MAG TPA: hypothetical protein VIG04_03350 [Gemmatimonadales bacterium]|jgi:photosystem II stability/assembly factor-like uncharacterized protein
MIHSPSLQVAVGTLAIAAFVALACSDGPTSSAPGVSMESRQASPAPTLTPQTSGTSQRFFAVSPVSSKVVWASAAGGTFARTTNGGRTWTSQVVPGAEALQFRDVEGVSEKVAYLLSAGEGPSNRIYKTEDGGRTWDLQFQAGADPRFFYDCFDFWTPIKGITFADGVDGRFPVIKTTDGENWRDIGDQLPAAQAGEAGFAASGTCIKTQGGKRAWIGTGGGAKARILATTNGGSSWTSHDVPILQGTPVSGVVSVDFRDPHNGILGGGDIVASTVPQNNVARSSDGGQTWILATSTPFPGAVYGLSYVPSLKRTVVATGPSGAAWSSNEGDTWSLLPGASNFWAVGFANEGTGWLVGGNGTILKIEFAHGNGGGENHAN